MCGIVGHVGDIGPPAEAEALVRRQLAALRHRGPDDSGVATGPGYALGHARLAIVDPALGHQPFESDDGRLVVTYNGEIYNYVELREVLRSLGHVFRTASDTEVLVRGWQEWGEAVLGRLDGMFAFALLDRADGTLTCARDPYGQKPFFWMEERGRFAFASECRAFAGVPGFAGSVDPASIADYLAFECFPWERSIWRGVRKLPPGHLIRYAQGRAEVRRWYDSIPGCAESAADPASAEREVHDLLRRSVERTFRADVPVGLLLSGGLDSALVLALLREVRPDVELKTFTVRNVDPSFDESGAAAGLAQAFRTEHEVVTADPALLATTASALPALLDEPQADPGILPMYLVCREIARSRKVALTGAGGDEIFYGYATFRAERIAPLVAMLPDAVHEHVLRPLASRLRATHRYMALDLKAKSFARGFPGPAHLRNFRWTSPFPDGDLARLLRPAGRDLRDVDLQLERIADRWQAARGPLGRLAYLYQQQYLPDYVLANADRASMLNSVELRTPYLSVDLVARLNALPDDVKMRGGETKALLRRIARKLLPGGIHRRRKMGFTAPVAALLDGPLREELRDLLAPDRLGRQGLFDPAFVGRLLDEHAARRHNHYKPLWTLYTLQKWLQTHASAP